MVCKKGLEIVPIKLPDGKWYMGTYNRQGARNCRLTEFVNSREIAVRMPLYKQFACADNENCNGGTGCFD